VNFSEFLPKKLNFSEFIEIYANFCSFSRVFLRIFLIYLAQAPQIDIPTPIFDQKTRIRPRSQKKT